MIDQLRMIRGMDGRTLTGPSLSPVCRGRADSELVHAIAQGDRGALLEVFDTHADLLYGVARRWCDPARAAGAVERAVLGLWYRPAAYVVDGTTLRERLVAQTRAEASPVVSSPPEERPDATPVGAEGSPLDRSVGPTLARRLRRLPAEQRQVILLAYVGGHSCASSSELLGRPCDVVAAQIARGLDGLRAQCAAERSGSCRCR